MCTLVRKVRLHADVSSAAIPETTYAFLMNLAQEGHVRGVVASPPYRSFSGYRYVAGSSEGADGAAENPLRLRGASKALWKD